jgi:hypothetical protein
MYSSRCAFALPDVRTRSSVVTMLIATGVAEACQIDATSDATKDTPQQIMTQHSVQYNTHSLVVLH